MDQLLPQDRVHNDSSLRLSLSEPIFRLWYEISKSTLSPDAVRYLDNLLAQPGRGPISAGAKASQQG